MLFRFSHRIIAGLTVFLITCSPALSGPVGEAETGIAVTARSHATVPGERIFLEDIADFHGTDSELILRLKKVFIARGPRPGRTLSISKRMVRFRLKKSGLPVHRIRLQMPDRIRIQRPGVRIPRERIEEIAREELRKKFDGRVWIRIGEVTARQDGMVPQEPYRHQVVFPKGRRLAGAVPLRVLFTSEGGYEDEIHVTARITALTPVLVAAKPLARFQPIGREDIRIEKRALSKTPSDALTDPAQVAGKRARRTISLGAVLTPASVELPPLVQRGDIVRILVKSNRIRITALGEVREKGRQGERIRVVMLDTQKEIRARVVDSETVTMKF